MANFSNPVLRWSHFRQDMVRLFFNTGYTTEGQGATLMLGLGLWLVIGGMFSTCPAVYYVMMNVANERLWGILFLTVGGVQVYALFRGSISLRRSMLLLKGAMWTTLLVTLLYGDWHAPGVPIYGILAVTAFRAFLMRGKYNLDEQAV
jgi:hypothetical protein